MGTKGAGTKRKQAQEKAPRKQPTLPPFEGMVEDSTCFPVALANAAKLIGKKLDSKHMIKVLEEADLLKPGNQGVLDGAKALRHLKSYLQSKGVSANHHAPFPAPKLFDLVPSHIPTNPEQAIIATLSHGYILQHHQPTIELPTDHFKEVNYLDGPSHDVLMICQDGQEVLFHDPDPSLQGPIVDQSFSPPLARMPTSRFKAFYHQGEYAREAVIVEPLKAKEPSAAQPQDQKAPPRLEPRLEDVLARTGDYP